MWTAALIGQGVAALALVVMLLALAPETPPAAALVPAVLGGVAGAVGALLQYRALAVLDMSVASPIVAGAALVPVLWGLARGEQPSALQLAGVAMTLVGIVVISRGPPHDRGGADATQPLRADRTGVLVAIGSAVTLGLFLVAVDYGDEAGPFWTVTVARTVAFIALALMAVASRPEVRPRGRALPILVVVAPDRDGQRQLRVRHHDGVPQHRRRARLAEPGRHHRLGTSRPARAPATAAGRGRRARVRGHRLHHPRVGGS